MIPSEGDKFAVYILKCKDSTLYTGQTKDLTRRLKEHNAGRGADYTAERLPVKLVHVETRSTRAGAMSREEEIKRLTRPKKARLVNSSPGPTVSERAGGSA